MGYFKSHLVLVLLLSLAWVAPSWGEGEEDQGKEVEVQQKEEVKEKEEVISAELLEEDDVLVLHQHNFDRALHEHRLLLVKFCK